MRRVQDIFGRFTRNLGIDLGTANTLVHVHGKGILVREPSVVAVDSKTGQILSVGANAKQMLGRTPGHIKAVRPLKDGVIADFEQTEAMLRYFIDRSTRRQWWTAPQVVVGIPSGVTEVERRAVLDATRKAGARDAFVVEEPMAAAIGAGLRVEEPCGCMVVDIGGGTTEVAVISLAGIVTSQSVRIAGEKIDEAIVSFVRRYHGMLIGDRTAEEIKLTVGSAFPLVEEVSMQIRGRDLISGLPKQTTLSSVEVREAILEPIAQIVEAVKQALERTPPELAADIMDSGICLAGGGALLRGLDELIHRATEMPVFIADDPLTCVAMGCGKILDEVERVPALRHALIHANS